MKQKHKLIIEVTFNAPVTEKNAKTLLASVIETGLGELPPMYRDSIQKISHPKAYRLVCAGNISALINKLFWRYRKDEAIRH